MISYGFANAFSKPLSKELGAPQTLFLRGFSIVVILLIAAIPTFHQTSNWPMVIGGVCLGIVGYLPVLAFTHAIKESPLGIIAPIAGASPVFTLLLSFLFLGVILHPAQWTAVILIVAANIAVSVDIRNWRNSDFLKISSGIPFALAAALGWGLFFFLLVPVSKELGPWLAALCVEIGVTIAAGVHTKFLGKKVHLRTSLRKDVVLNGFLICLGTVAFTIGVRYFNVGIVAALSNSTALIATLIGVYMFHEKLKSKDRIAAAVIIVCIAVLPLL